MYVADSTENEGRLINESIKSNLKKNNDLFIVSSSIHLPI